MLATILAGCAQPPTVGGGSSEQQFRAHVAKLASLEQWMMDGRISVSSSKGGGSARINWQQNGDQYRIKLIAPLGQGGAIVMGDGQQVLVKLSDGQELRGTDASVLLEQMLGWPVPVESLRHMIKGLPSPMDQYELNNQSLVKELQSGQWRADFDNYKSISGYRLPGLISLSGPPAKLKITVNEWQL
ncbi:MAG: outer membrane lipoprotein LolB [Gammaproteobacteria bacterium]|nr:outer membrane lipoprotein LolB [Gammaproteobacteria bacterium]